MPRLKQRAPPRRFLRRPAVLNAAPTGKVPLAKSVQRSCRRYANLRSKTPRFAKRVDKAVSTAGIAVYNTSVGARQSMANLHSVRTSSQRARTPPLHAPSRGLTRHCPTLCGSQNRQAGTFSAAPRFKNSAKKSDLTGESIHINAGMADRIANSARRCVSRLRWHCLHSVRAVLWRWLHVLWRWLHPRRLHMHVSPPARSRLAADACAELAAQVRHHAVRHTPVPSQFGVRHGTSGARLR